MKKIIRKKETQMEEVIKLYKELLEELKRIRIALEKIERKTK